MKTNDGAPWWSPSRHGRGPDPGNQTTFGRNYSVFCVNVQLCLFVFLIPSKRWRCVVIVFLCFRTGNCEVSTMCEKHKINCLQLRLCRTSLFHKCYLAFVEARGGILYFSSPRLSITIEIKRFSLNNY